MAYCWQSRGCDEEIWSRCPHNVPGKYSPCPIDCCFTSCDKPQHRQATVMEMLDSDADLNAPQKEQCRSCGFFLSTAPRISETVSE